jgi:hypothetical protein
MPNTQRQFTRRLPLAAEKNTIFLPLRRRLTE